jgi:5,10-methylenetetrahydromethanopterin reductase
LAAGVVPVSPRHPRMLAQQIRTVVDVVGPRLTVGLGYSHRHIVEERWGQSYATPFSSLRDHLDQALPELTDDRGRLPCDVLLGALGPRMLDLAGRRTQGTVLWMTGPATIRDYVAPTLQAARPAGLEPPRIVAIVPVVVTDDLPAGDRLAARAVAGYGRVPAYRRMLRRQEVLPEALAVVGETAVLAEAFTAYLQAGATEIVALPIGSVDTRAEALGVIAEARRRLVAATWRREAGGPRRCP